MDVLTESVPWRWDVESFLRAHEAGIFGRRHVEMIEGEVRCVVHGNWHGRTREDVAGALRELYRGSSWWTTSETLLLGDSAPDPDVWVLRRDAEPVATLGRVRRYDIADVALVVEVGDSSEAQDLGLMAAVYGTAGVPAYWVITRQGIHVHTGPLEGGYAQRRLFGHDEEVVVPGVETSVLVRDLLAPA